MRKLMLAVLAILLLSSTFVDAKSNELSQQTWTGHATLPDQNKLPLTLSIYHQSYGKTANVSSPAQGVVNIPVTNLVVSDTDISMVLPTLGAKLSLQFTSAQCLEGELNQRIVMPVQFCLTQESEKGNEWVTPLNFQADDGVWLSGSLYRPETETIKTIAIIAHGSGPTDRAGSFGNHQLYANLAGNLATENIAVFTYDKRGIQRSQGNYAEADVATFTDDYLAAYDFIRAKFPNAEIGFVGHSEGATVVAMAANRVTPNFVVSLGGVGLNGVDAIVLQDKTESMAKGATLTQATILQDIARQFYTLVLTAENEQQRSARIEQLLAELSPQQREVYEVYGATTYTLAQENIHDAALHGILATDPTQYWRHVCVPTLVMNGENDVQVPADENVTGIEQARKACEKGPVDTVILANYNHMFQETEDGNVALYDELPNGFDTEVTQSIANWIKVESRQPIAHPSN